MKKNILVICSLIIPVCLINPAVIYYLNPQFDDIPILHMLGLFGAISLVIVIALAGIIRYSPAAGGKVMIVIMASIAVVAYVQAQIFSPMLELDMTGETIDWARLGTRPMIEGFILLLVLAITTLIVWRHFEFRHWVAGLILVGAGVSGIFEALEGAETYAVSAEASHQEIDSSVFGFSRSTNVIHLMPDAVQTDIAASILRENDELAQKFAGFILFENHLGGFHSTAPTLPSVFIGDFYDLSNGYQAPDVRKVLREQAYPNHLASAGYELDFATASPLVCVGQGARCIHLPFGDFRSRGYATSPDAWLVNIGLLVDLSLFRQSPALLKPGIYNAGGWTLSHWAAESSVNYFEHAPVLAEWRKNGYVVDDGPRYKWYHWIGAHAPQMWDAKCTYVGNQPWDSESVFAQTECVLHEIAMFLDSLRELGVYDQSLIVISSDHGTNQFPSDLRNYVHTELFRPGEIGTARPLLMAKRFNHSSELAFSLTPTSIIDIAPTILSNAEIDHGFSGHDVFELQPDEVRTRSYHKYARPPFRWGPNPVPLDRWSIVGDVRNWDDWKPYSFYVDSASPDQMNTMTNDELAGFVWGTIVGGTMESGIAKVLGRDLILVMQPRTSEALVLELEMIVPELENVQNIQLFVNGEKSAQAVQLQPDGFGQWQQVRFCIDENLVVDDDDNLFHLRMSDTVPMRGREDRLTSAQVRSARLDYESVCANGVRRMEE